MNKHTPGPWIHAKDQGQVGSIELPDGTVIAQSQSLVGDRNREIREANARLISAAPDLLEIVTSYVETMEGLPDCDETSLAVWDFFTEAKSALSKATGK